MCKKCITAHVDNFNPDTYLWILQEVDVPYIPDEWNKLIVKWGKDDPSKLTGLSIIGRYFSTMKLKQYRDYRWKDTEFLQEVANKKIEETMKRQGYGAAEIAETISKGSFVVPEGDLRPPPNSPVAVAEPAVVFEAPQHESAEELGLTEEDVSYLKLKWGKAYRPDEWLSLETLYNEFCESYDIQTAGHIDTLKLICKTSLKAHQLIDLGDVESY
jgi:hypothetical protein